MRKNYTRHKKDKNFASGFTLIELLMVMGVLAGLAGIMVFQFPASQRRARDAQRRSDIKQYQTAVEAYANVNNGTYPPDSGTLVSICGSHLNTAACPEDPRAPPNYRYRGDGGMSYVLWATLEQPDDAGDIVFFVTCSEGGSGDTTTDPSSGCPL